MRVSPGRASLARPARLDIPRPAPDKPQPNEPEIAMSTDKLAKTIDDAFEARDKIGPKTKGAVRKAVECRARPARCRQGARRRAAGRRPLARQSMAEEGRAAVVPPQRHERDPRRARQGRVVGQGRFQIQGLERRRNSGRPASAPCPAASCAARPSSRPAWC